VHRVNGVKIRQYDVGNLVSLISPHPFSDVPISHSLAIILEVLEYKDVSAFAGPSPSSITSWLNAGAYRVFDFQQNRSYIFRGDYLRLVSK
jgi:hypothetical protein